MTVADLTDDQREEIYQLFFGARLITEWSDGTGRKRYDNSIQSISDKTNVSKFVVNAYIDKCLVIRKLASKPVSIVTSKDEQEITITYNSRMNYEI